MNYVVCLSDTDSSCHVTVMGSLIVLVNKKYSSVGRITIFGTYVFKSNLEHFWQMSRWSPVYVPEIETGKHVKNNACAVEIKIKLMIRKHMTYENTYRDDNNKLFSLYIFYVTNSTHNTLHILSLWNFGMQEKIRHAINFHVFFSELKKCHLCCSCWLGFLK